MINLVNILYDNVPMDLPSVVSPPATSPGLVPRTSPRTCRWSSAARAGAAAPWRRRVPGRSGDGPGGTGGVAMDGWGKPW